MYEILRRLIPTQNALRENRWLAWLGPSIHHPRLRRMKRRSVALGAGIGVFFAFILPIAQIPMSVGAAVLAKANVPVAVVSTLVNNPLTFGPVYYAAWRVGCVVLGEDDAVEPTSFGGSVTALEPEPGTRNKSWWERAASKAASVGKPLMVGASAFAVGFGLLAYTVVLSGWGLIVRMRRQKRVMSSGKQARLSINQRAENQGAKRRADG